MAPGVGADASGCILTPQLMRHETQRPRQESKTPCCSMLALRPAYKEDMASVQLTILNSLFGLCLFVCLSEGFKFRFRAARAAKGQKL